MFQHRHYVFLAQTIAGLDLSEADRCKVAREFANALRGTNPNFDYGRFESAAMGQPINGRDK